MKKRIVSLAISAVFVLAVFSGCAAIRRNRTDEIGRMDALDGTTNSIGNYLARNTTEGVYQTPGNWISSTTGVDNATARRNLTVDHIAALVGMNEADINTALGKTYHETGYGSANRTYNHTVYGNSADLDVTFGTGNKIEQIVVTADRSDAARWRRELDARYGTMRFSNGTLSEWIVGGSHVTMQQLGENVRIVFSNTL